MRVDGKPAQKLDSASTVTAPADASMNATNKPKKSRTKKSPVTSVDSQASTKTIHNIFVLDESGSMSGPKQSAVREGMSIQLRAIQNDTSGVKHRVTVVRFGSSHNIILEHFFVDTLTAQVSNYGGASLGMTALFDAIKLAGDKADEVVKNAIQVDGTLINIFTDGGENDSKKLSAYRAPKYLENLRSKYTVSFIGTSPDIEYMVNKLGVDRGNTVVHNNTAESIASTMKFTAQARTAYSKHVGAGGQSAITDFYTKTVDTNGKDS